MSSLKELHDKLWAHSINKSHTCDLCNREVFSYPHPRLCNRCLEKLPKNDGDYCDKCGRATKTEGVCFQCKGDPPTFTKACSPFVYFGEGALMINAFKNGKRYLSFYLAEEMFSVFDRLGGFDETPFLIPVPLTKRKRRERGYNQAEELTKQLSAMSGFPMKIDLIEKVRQDGQQKHLTAKERKEHVVGAFHLIDRKFCKDKLFLVVDDILTTGATCGELARLLMGAGARAVFVCTACSLPERE